MNLIKLGLMGCLLFACATDEPDLRSRPSGEYAREQKGSIMEGSPRSQLYALSPSAKRCKAWAAGPKVAITWRSCLGEGDPTVTGLVAGGSALKAVSWWHRDRLVFITSDSQLPGPIYTLLLQPGFTGECHWDEKGRQITMVEDRDRSPVFAPPHGSSGQSLSVLLTGPEQDKIRGLILQDEAYLFWGKNLDDDVAKDAGVQFQIEANRRPNNFSRLGILAAEPSYPETEPQGLFVTQVAPGSAAFVQGIRAESVIKSVNGIPLSNLDQLQRIAREGCPDLHLDVLYRGRRSQILIQRETKRKFQK